MNDSIDVALFLEQLADDRHIARELGGLLAEQQGVPDIKAAREHTLDVLVDAARDAGLKRRHALKLRAALGAVLANALAAERSTQASEIEALQNLIRQLDDEQ